MYHESPQLHDTSPDDEWCDPLPPPASSGTLIAPPPPPDPDLLALKPLAAAALRNSLLAASRITDNTKDSDALAYLRESRLAAALIYRYTQPLPARPRTPTFKELKEARDEE